MVAGLAVVVAAFRQRRRVDRRFAGRNPDRPADLLLRLKFGRRRLVSGHGRCSLGDLFGSLMAQCRFAGRNFGRLAGEILPILFVGCDRRTPHRVAAALAVGAALAMPVAAAAPSTGTMIGIVVGVPLGALLLVEQRLPVGDRNLIIVGMDFRERQKAVAIAAVIDE